MRVPSVAVVLTAATAWGAFAGSLPAVPADRLPQLPVESIHRGQTGYGITVFAGETPERFEVEVLGVLRNSQPGLSYVLARLTGHGLEKSGVAAGMSGSPVYIDGRLVGAVAFSWPYASEAIAGITPIADMRALAAIPSGLDRPAPRPNTTVPLTALLGGGLPEDFAQREIARLAPAAADPAGRTAIQWVTTGFSDQAVARLAGPLGAVSAAGGQGASTTQVPLQDGGPVAGMLVEGDLRLAAIGTVTERHGDEILAFGHSFLGVGPSAVPMATAEVITVMPSSYSSFKISNLGQVVGAIEQDHQVGIRGRIGQQARTLPAKITVSGVRERTFNLRFADLEELVPALLASAAVGALDTTSFSTGPHTLDLEATFRLARYGDLTVRQTFDGPSAVRDATNQLVGMAAYLTGNTLEKVTLEGIEVSLRQDTARQTLTLVSVHASRTVVRPGETVRLFLEFQGYRGEPVRRSIEVTIPLDAPAGKLGLWVGDGESADAARLAAEPVVPDTIAEALALLRSYRNNRELVVLPVTTIPGMTVDGVALPRLPGSIQSIWKAGGTAVTTRALRQAVGTPVVEPLPFPATGLVKLEVEVRRPEPQKDPAAAKKNRSAENFWEVGR